MPRTPHARTATRAARMVACLAGFLFAGVSHAQFSPVGDGVVLERIAGMVLPGLDAESIEAGDQIGAFFNDQLIGSAQIDATNGNEFDITLTGDNPATDAIEGPDVGDPVEFRFFDSSTNFVVNDIRVETVGGERFNFTFQGADLSDVLEGDGPPLPIDFFIPSRNFNLRVTEGGGPGGGGNGDGGGDSGGGNGGNGGGGGFNLDVNGDGEVTRKDAALVMRAIGAARAPSRMRDSGDPMDAAQLQSADVNDDGVVSSQDVAAVIRGIHALSRPDRGANRPDRPSAGDGNADSQGDDA